VDALKVWNAIASQTMPRAKSAPSMPKWPTTNKHAHRRMLVHASVMPCEAMLGSTRKSNDLSGQFLAKPAAMLAPQGMQPDVHTDVRRFVHKLCVIAAFGLCERSTPRCRNPGASQTFLLVNSSQTSCNACAARDAAPSPHRCPKACPQGVWIDAFAMCECTIAGRLGHADIATAVKVNVW
jgi:hypothetical protein